MSKKCVIVLNQFAVPRSQSGGTRHVELFELLNEWSATIIAGNRNHSNQEEYKTTEPLMLLVKVPATNRSAVGRLYTWIVYVVRAFVAACRLPRIDVVYGSTPHLLAPLMGLVIARLRGAAFVLEVRDLWPESFVSAGLIEADGVLHRLLSVLERLLVRRADAIVAVTGGWEDHFVRLGANGSLIRVIPNGSTPFRASGYQDDPTGLRRHGYRRVGIFAGSHGPKDGINSVLDAAALNPDVGVVLVGDGPEKKHAQERVDRERISNVVFLDPVPKSQLGQLLVSCDFGIHSVSPLDVFQLGMSPNKLFDYMAAGLPVVSNAGEGVTKIFGDYEMGELSTHAGFAEAFAVVANSDDEELSRMGREAMRNLENNFSRVASAGALSELLDLVTAGREK